MSNRSGLGAQNAFFRICLRYFFPLVFNDLEKYIHDETELKWTACWNLHLKSIWLGAPNVFFWYMFEILFAILFLTILRNISMMKLNLNKEVFKMYILNRMGPGAPFVFFPDISYIKISLSVRWWENNWILTKLGI